MPRNGRVWLVTFAGLWLLFAVVAVIFGRGWPVWAAYPIGAINGMATIAWADTFSRMPRFNQPKKS